MSAFQKMHIVLIGIASTAWLGSISYWAYHAGKKARLNERFIITETISSQILALLALIMGFAFSLAISRFETRRELAIREANAIETAYQHSDLIHFKDPLRIKKMFKEYVDLKMADYDSSNPFKYHKRLTQLELELWNTFTEVAKKDRGALENSYAMSLHSVFDTANTRNFALIKMLPAPFYLLILVIVTIGLISLNYDRGYKGDDFHWRAASMIFLFGLLLIFIYDLDHAQSGWIKISQDAFVELRQRM